MGSDAPLLEKLGYQPGDAVDTVGAPEWFLEYLRGNDVHTHAKPPAQWMHIFTDSRDRLWRFMEHAKLGEIQKGIWISWPEHPNDRTKGITEQTLRSVMLPFGWTDVKTCRIDSTWNGLQFVSQPINSKGESA